MRFCMELLWDDLRVFLAIARAGTLTAAAPQLGLSQPTLGRRLRAFERACGAALFQRTPRGFVLTDEGEATMRHAERMQEEALAIERRLGGGERGLEGHLRLSSSEWFSRVALAGPVAEFTKRHPAIAIELIADSRILDLDRRETDLAFRFTKFAGPDVVATRLVHIRYDLFATRGYLRRKRAPHEHRLIGMNQAYDAMPDVAWLRARYPGAAFAVRSNSRDVQASACARGAGLAVLPRALGAELRLERVAVREAPPGRDVWLGYHVDLRRLERLRALVDYLTSAIGAEL
jgi:DNA-binding transcriptional LysR family regulator